MAKVVDRHTGESKDLSKVADPTCVMVISELMDSIVKGLAEIGSQMHDLAGVRLNMAQGGKLVSGLASMNEKAWKMAGDLS